MTQVIRSLTLISEDISPPEEDDKILENYMESKNSINPEYFDLDYM